MKILHTSDLHLGKRIHEYSLAEDQRHMLEEIVRIAREERPDAVVIAGDVYDRAAPSEEAISMFGSFLTEMSSLDCSTLIIAGNHDSGTRLDYCNDILSRNRIHISGRFTGRMEKVVLEDLEGPVNFWLLPYFQVSAVRSLLEKDVTGYPSAMAAILEDTEIDTTERNVLVAHQFFAGSGMPEVSDSEEQRPEVGGISCIPCDMLDAFDYVALGHLHLPQKVGRDTVRYSGSPLKYSASEARTEKSLSVIELGRKGDTTVRTVPLSPLRDLRVLKGTVEDILSAATEYPEGRDDYVIVELPEPPASGTDEIFKAFPKTLQIKIVDRGGDAPELGMEADAVVRVPPAELFSRFYQELTGKELTPYQTEVLEGCLQLGGGDTE